MGVTVFPGSLPAPAMPPAYFLGGEGRERGRPATLPTYLPASIQLGIKRHISSLSSINPRKRRRLAETSVYVIPHPFKKSTMPACLQPENMTDEQTGRLLNMPSPSPTCNKTPGEEEDGRQGDRQGGRDLLKDRT